MSLSSLKALKRDGAAKTCSAGVVRSPSIFHLCIKKLLLHSNIDVRKRKKNKSVKIFLILLTKGVSGFPSCHFLTLFLFTFRVACLSSFSLLLSLSAKQHRVSSPAEGYWRARRPTSSLWPWTFVSQKQDCLLGKTNLALGWWRGRHDPPAVSFDVGSYWDCTGAFTYARAQITDLQL